MKLFIDGRMLGNSGIGRYTQNIVEKINGQYTSEIALTVLLNKKDREFLREAENITLVYPRLLTKIYTVKEQFVLFRSLREAKPDLVHFPNFNVALGSAYPFVVTIHDLIYLNYPGACPNTLAKLYAWFMITQSCRRARLVITVSEYSKQDIVKTIGINEQKIRVIYSGVDAKYQPVEEPLPYLRKYSLPEKYILYVGNHERRKNIPELIMAWVNSGLAKDYFLLIAGRKDMRRTEIYDTIRQFGVGKKVLFTDYLGEEVLPALYTQARMLVFPSSYEGFGLPILEAMGCGTPVVCSRASSIPEVAGEAAFYVDPKNSDEFGVALKRVAEDEELRGALREKGFERVKKFTWGETVKKHIAVYKEAVRK